MSRDASEKRTIERAIGPGAIAGFIGLSDGEWRNGTVENAQSRELVFG